MIRKPKNSSPDILVYCGPTVKGTVKRDTVFSGELPPEVKAIIRKHVILRELTVSLGELAETKKSLRDKNSRLCRIFRQAEKEILKEENQK